MNVQRSMVMTICMFLILVGTGSIVLDAYASTEDVAASEPASPEMQFNAYLPMVQGVPGSLYGRVTEDGSPLQGFPVRLKFCRSYVSNPMSDCIYETHVTATDADGLYEFLDMPTLVLTDTYGGGQLPQTYQVWWDREEESDRLETWRTQKLDAYTFGDRVRIGDYDIGGIELVAPPVGVDVDFPVVFRWTVRDNDPPSSYNACIVGGYFNPMDRHPSPDKIGCDQPLGQNVYEFVLTEPFEGIDYDYPYWWYVQVTDGQGGSGRSYQSDNFFFTAP